MSHQLCHTVIHAVSMHVTYQQHVVYILTSCLHEKLHPRASKIQPSTNGMPSTVAITTGEGEEAHTKTLWNTIVTLYAYHRLTLCTHTYSIQNTYDLIIK